MSSATVISPESCRDMAEIRHEIDRIDQQVISLIGERYQFVKAAAKFKKTADQVQANSRFESMLRQRREWAKECGLQPDVIEALYRDLVGWFISEEMTHWSGQQSAADR